MASSAQIVRSSSSSLYSATSQSSHEVFISFCGTDTRTSFVDHLYAAFEQRGLIVFKDDKKLERGKLIREGLLEAIEQSQYAVVVISENFAFSKWCLIELDKIVECETKKGLKILPIFYHIDPFEVRKQQKIFAQAFAKHEQDPDVGEKQRTAWNAALKKVGNIAGWHVEPKISAEADVVKDIAGEILCAVRINSSKSFEGLFGIESRVKKLWKELCLEMDDVQMIGIYGMPGIGKTTLAEILFKIVRYEFEESCFICCGNNKGILELYQQIVQEILQESNLKIWDYVRGRELMETRLCNKKIFIVLDDVNRKQLKNLIGSANWFGQGSRIVVTAKNRQLLKPFVNKMYKVEPLGYKDALELFCQKAFKTFHPKPSYLGLVENIMRQVNGHPLAITVIGSSLFGKGKEEWIGVHDVLEADSEGEILTKLQISYGMLGDSLKKCFLDIACFGGWFVDILKIFDSSTNSHIGALEDKSLINISRFAYVGMHNLLRKLGQQEVIKMSPLEPGSRSRAWVTHDIIHVLNNNSGTATIERIVMNFNNLEDYLLAEQGVEVKYECFSRMSRLTVLIIFGLFQRDKVKWIGDPSKLMLSNELRVIIWDYFPLKSLPSSFQANNLVQLYLRSSKMKVLWTGKKNFGQLKNINLSYSEYLTETPDLSGVPNLEKLELRDCAHLRKIHPSITNLGKLVQLNLYGCWRLGDNMTSSLHLVSHNSGIETDTPYSLKEIGSDPHSTCNFSSLTALTSLTSLGLGHCNLSNRDIPNDFSCFSFLEYLDLSGNRFTRIPKGITQLSNLKHLYMYGGRFLQSLSTSPPSSLSSLAIVSDLGCLSWAASLHLSRNNFITLLDNFFLLSKLQYLSLRYSSQFRALPKFPLSLINVVVEDNTEMNTEMNYHHARKLPLYSGVWFSVATNTSYDGTPYKFLQLNPRHLSNDYRDYRFAFGEMFAWGPTLVFETPGWFNHICIKLFHKIQCRVDVDLEYREKGLALFVAYQVHEQENSNFSISQGTNSMFPEFVCRFRASDSCEELPLVFRVPEVPFVGPNGFWAYIPAELFKSNGMELYNCHYLETSFETSNLNVGVKECGICLVYEHNVSEFFDVLNGITPHGLELENLQDFDFDVMLRHGK